jgi:hypothetical protein
MNESRRGSLTVETAIFLPLFIVGMLTLGGLIRLTAVSENVFHVLADETGRIAAQSGVAVLPVGFKGDVRTRVLDENEARIKSADVSPVLYRIPYAGKGKVYTNLIGASVNYETRLGVPELFRGGVSGSETVICRAFVGAGGSGTRMPFSEMEKDDDSRTVWVFPRAGERYHSERCSYIKNEPHEVILTASVRGKYKACKLCDPNAAGDGSLVYVYLRSGGVYHKGSCYIVERYVISISEDEAKEKGYSACAKCRGR